jgi:hypothetical protein
LGLDAVLHLGVLLTSSTRIGQKEERWPQEKGVVSCCVPRPGQGNTKAGLWIGWLSNRGKSRVDGGSDTSDGKSHKEATACSLGG